MNNRLILAVVLAILAFTFTLPVSAQTAEPTPNPWSFTLRTSFQSRYVGSETAFVFSKTPVSQSNFTANFAMTKDTTVYIDVWGSQAFNGKHSEIDYSIGIRGKVGEFRYTTEVAYYDVQQIGTNRNGDVIKLGGTFGRGWNLANGHSLGIDVYANFYAVAGKSDSIRNGCTFGLTTSYVIPITSKLNLRTAVVVNGNNNGLIFKAGANVSGEVGLTYKPTKHWKFDTSVRGHVLFVDGADIRRNGPTPVVWSVAATLCF